jgi:hypothetical protein
MGGVIVVQWRGVSLTIRAELRYIAHRSLDRPTFLNRICLRGEA